MLKRKIITLLFCFLIFPAIGMADNATKTRMRNLLESYIQLIPNIYNGNITDPSVKNKLKKLEGALKAAKHDQMLSSPNFSPLISILNESIKDIRASYNNKMYSFSEVRLKNIITVCSACHSQLPAKTFNKIKHSYKGLLDKNVKNHYDRAMIDYFLRDYQSAINYLTKTINQLNNGKKYNSKTKKHLNEVLKIYLMNLKDPGNGLKFLTEQKKSLPDNKRVQQLISDWQKSLKTWQKTKLPESTNESQLKALIKQHLEPIEDTISYGNISAHAVTLYSMQGVLSDFVVSNKNSKLLPKVLYWLGLIENQSHTLYLYSLGDLYLKQCVLKYPKAAVAKKCYQAYHDSVVFGFTGSAGTNIPLDVRRELESLKSKVIFNEKREP